MVPALKFWKCDTSIASESRILGFGGEVLVCELPPKKSVLGLENSLASKSYHLILVAFITGNSSLEPLIEGLYAQIHVNLRWRVFGRNRTGPSILGCDQQNLENFLSDSKWSGRRLAHVFADGWSTASHVRKMILSEAPTGTLLFCYKDMKQEIVHTLMLEKNDVSAKWVIIMDRRQDSNVTLTSAGTSWPSVQDHYCARGLGGAKKQRGNEEE